MTFPNAFEGIKKVFLAQILALIGSGCSIIGSVTGALGLVAGSTATGVGGGLFVLAGVVLSLLSLIFNLIGLSRASKDEETFKKAFFVSLVSLILSVILSIFSIAGIGGSVLSGLSNIITTVLGIILIAHIIKGIWSLAQKMGRNDVADKGQRLLSFLWAAYGVTIFCYVMMLLFSSSAGVLSVIGILSFVSGIAMIVGYILYLVHLNRAKNMLAE